MNWNDNLFLNEIFLNRDKIEDYSKYPYNIEVVKNFDRLRFSSPVTFFSGENGVGKSTFIEAIAVALRLPSEGGTQNFEYSTNNTTSELHEYLSINMIRKPKTRFFLRAESFYNFSTEVQRLAEEDHFSSLYLNYGGNLHKASHGEAFIKLVKNRFSDNGLYILDEPEAALSPQGQFTLLCLIDNLVKKGSQFIIATHSPILLGYRNAEIYDLNNNFKKIKYEETDTYLLYKRYLDNYEQRQHELFD